jgi:hypothetical protein
MFIILGLVVLVAAVVVGVAGVLTNRGNAHLLTRPFSVFGYHVHGSTGRLFLYGIIVGGVAVFGLSLLLSAARHTSRRDSVARQGLKQSRGETKAVAKDRDDVIDQRDDLIAQREGTRIQAAGVVRNTSPDANADRDSDASQRSLLHPLGHGASTPQTSTRSSPDR